MTITLKDVAKQASVSVATVSLVLNERTSNVRISDETRKRVIEVARSLNYFPNRAARALRLKKSYTIGIVSFDTNDPISSAYVTSLEHILNQFGYRAIVSDAQHQTSRAMGQIEYFSSANVEGLILLASSYSIEKDTLDRIRQEKQLSLISVMRDLSANDIASFIVNYYSGTKNATRHLLDAGYRRFGVIVGSDIYAPDHLDRLQGVIDACSERGIVLDPRLIVHEDEGGWIPAAGYRSMNELLKHDPLPDAVVAFDDATAFGAIRAIYDAGIRVPEDIAVVGFDDLAVSEFYNPPLTTVRHPIKLLSSKAVEYLVQTLEGLPDVTPACSSFEPELVIRQSTNRLLAASTSRKQI